MSYWQGFLVAVAAFIAVTSVAADVAKLTLQVEGIAPTECSSPPAIRATMQRFAGVLGADVSLERGEATLEYEPGQLDLEKLIATVERLCLVKITPLPAR